MCSPATCRTCGKASYTGCGKHVDQVLAGVPAHQRCSCSPTERSAESRSMLSRLFGR
ncbi:hypothetical protein [Nakamurella multipartita]|uniref:Uncharacterized protein n=1 Tax=Nakamurella multipartita (strain ATCC 700099 / DSM 44233 / CIP 104796 / JCM 9543 / NBRC 105858 / Y-104) TaxID=479431 RepID=C8X614_NAKMY|nr:hypothetical protein [Nakamurella multipartita]ACV76785.1 hypothetical protein Namu_0355 [Nakamurella multipartita DSM 44233]